MRKQNGDNAELYENSCSADTVDNQSAETRHFLDMVQKVESGAVPFYNSEDGDFIDGQLINDFDTEEGKTFWGHLEELNLMKRQ